MVNYPIILLTFRFSLQVLGTREIASNLRKTEKFEMAGSYTRKFFKTAGAAVGHISEHLSDFFLAHMCLQVIFKLRIQNSLTGQT